MTLRPVFPLLPPGSPAAAAALEAEIDRSGSREHVARLAVHLARAYVEATAIFTVLPDRIEGVAGEGIDGSLAAVLLPVRADSLFARVAASGEAYRGRPPAGALDQRVLGVMGRLEVEEITLLPVTLRGRVVNLLYADNGPEVLGDAATAALGTVCTRVARAYTRLILERRARTTREPTAGLGAALLRA
jgi:hypothetical protein